jgi:hypothetical protein
MRSLRLQSYVVNWAHMPAFSLTWCCRYGSSDDRDIGVFWKASLGGALVDAGFDPGEDLLWLEVPEPGARTVGGDIDIVDMRTPMTLFKGDRRTHVTLHTPMAAL